MSNRLKKVKFFNRILINLPVLKWILIVLSYSNHSFSFNRRLFFPPAQSLATPEGHQKVIWLKLFSPQHQTFSPISHSHWQILVLIGWRTTAVAHGGRNVTMLSASYFWIEKNIYLNSFQRSFYEQEGEKRLNMHLTEWCKKGPLMSSSSFLQMSSKLICLYHFQTRK